MTFLTWEEQQIASVHQFCLHDAIVVQDLEEYTFHAPRVGFFLDDSLTPDGDTNPVTRFDEDVRTHNIPHRPASRPFLGTLDALAAELICQVLWRLDMYSLLEFRSVNQHARDLVEAFPPYRSVAAFPMLLGAVKALRCRSWSIESLISCILNPRCSFCGNHGDLVYLVTPERWCYPCFLDDTKNFIPVMPPTSEMTEEAALKILKRVLHVQCSPGHYGMRGEGYLHHQLVIFDRRALYRALLDTFDKYRFDERLHLLRYAVVLRAPYWDTYTQRFEEGLCRACATQRWKYWRGHSQIRH